MANTIKDKVVIVTGASSGIGKACAIAFANAGCKVMLAARDEVKLTLVMNEITQRGGIAAICKTDVSKEEDCQQLINTTIQQFGTIHILINNAGNSMRAIFAEVDLNVLKNLMDLNFWGTVYCTKFAMN